MTGETFWSPVWFSGAPAWIPSPNRISRLAKIKAHFSKTFAGTVYSPFSEITFQPNPLEKQLWCEKTIMAYGAENNPANMKVKKTLHREVRLILPTVNAKRASLVMSQCQGKTEDLRRLREDMPGHQKCPSSFGAPKASDTSYSASSWKTYREREETAVLRFKGYLLKVKCR